jgi:hypothetical protein
MDVKLDSQAREATIEMIVTRADGTVENLVSFRIGTATHSSALRGA